MKPIRTLVQIKEFGNSYVSNTTYVGPQFTKEGLIDTLGLNEPDVEWYNIATI